MVKLFGKTLKTTKGQKGGKVLGQGSFGCVIDSLTGKKDTVSKLINLDEVADNSSQMKEIVDEYTKGEIFRKNDPKNRFFLPVLSMEKMSGRGASKEVRNDLQTCGYSKDGNILNFSIKRGGKFQKIGVILSEKELMKSLLYSLHGAKKCIDELNTGLFDIKPDNLLFSITHHDDKEFLHPTFIDFSSDFVLTSEQEFLKFFPKWSSRGQMTYYQYWSYEILTMIYMTFDQHNSKNMSKSKKYRAKQDFEEQIYAYHEIPKTKKLFDKKIQEYIIKTMGKKDSHKILTKGAMVWAIAKSYHRIFDQKKSNYTGLVEKMLRHDPEDRPSLEESIKMVEKALGMQTTMPHDVAIDITNHKHKEQIYKIFGIGKKQEKKIGLMRKIFNIKKKKKETGRKVKSSIPKKKERKITKAQKRAILKNKRLTKSQKVAILTRGL